MSESLYCDQNLNLKLSSIFLAIIITAFLELNILLLLVIGTICFLAFDYRLIIAWSKLFLKLLPFFSSLIFLSILFSVPIELQLILISKISYILLLSVYLIKTSSLSQLVKSKRSKMYNRILEFLLLTLNFIPLFYENFSTLYQNSHNIVETFSEATAQTYEAKDEVVKRTTEIIQIGYQESEFYNLANLILTAYITFEIILFSIKF